MTVLERLGGVLAPLTTPFDRVTGDVAPIALRANARAILEAGATGLVVAGSTGEAPLLTEEESRKCVGWVREVMNDEHVLIVGAGRESTRSTVAACRAAAEEGAQTALVRPPVYFASALSRQAVVDHFRAVADESPIPILLYNIPKYTNLPLTAFVLASLADHPNVLGAKDSSGDLKNFAAYRDVVPEWRLFIGSGALLYAALELGAVGGILAVANFAIDTAVTIARLFRSGDKAAAGRAQERLTPLHKEIVGGLGPAGVKGAMDAVGLTGGPVRGPLANLSDADGDHINSLLRTAGLIPAEV